ncbi:MOSC domain-containing protein [Natronorubrum texcoconense]|uniref:MOSC domain-containing protein YiiM n=1 Tax=Natronorubrum texcoconense TaxID=1095776 RepID=A0A1G8TEU2_9EURY|nr:MOSC domain-containing protein [Natronorubrum texcoconense]SDJ40028.1 MOSC domain-containing protein YiiM [Natronorubrum texcoconense]
MTANVRAIHIAPEQGEPMEQLEEVRAVAKQGLEGDRYFDTDGTFADRDGSDLTLIEREALEGVADEYDISLEPGVHRRNVTTEGVALNHLVGERFRVGDVVCEGVELCEPCSYLERHLEKQGVREALVHRGGLRARILEGGDVATGAPIERVE